MFFTAPRLYRAWNKKTFEQGKKMLEMNLLEKVLLILFLYKP